MDIGDKSRDSGAPRPDTLTRLGRVAAASAGGAVALWLLYKIRVVLLILLAGMALAYALAPLVTLLSGNRPRLRGLGIALAYLVVVLGLTAAGALGFRPLADDARSFAAAAPDTVSRFDTWLAGVDASVRRLFPSSAPAQPDPGPANLLETQLRSQAANLGRYAGGLAAAGQSFATLAGGAALALVVSVFILADPGYLQRQVFSVIPVAHRPEAEALWTEIDLVLAAFVRGQIVIAAVVGVSATVAMALLGVKYAVVLGLFTAVTQLIPQIGGVIGMVAAVALSALQSPALALAVFAVYMVLYQVSGNVLGPLVMGKAVQLHPFVILVATMVGTVMGGVVGLLLSVPIAAVLKVVWNFFYPRLAPRWGLEAPRD